jgi:hypothetical protein
MDECIVMDSRPSSSENVAKTFERVCSAYFSHVLTWGESSVPVYPVDSSCLSDTTDGSLKKFLRVAERFLIYALQLTAPFAEGSDDEGGGEPSLDETEGLLCGILERDTILEAIAEVEYGSTPSPAESVAMTRESIEKIVTKLRKFRDRVGGRTDFKKMPPRFVSGDGVELNSVVLLYERLKTDEGIPVGLRRWVLSRSDQVQIGQMLVSAMSMSASDKWVDTRHEISGKLTDIRPEHRLYEHLYIRNLESMVRHLRHLSHPPIIGDETISLSRDKAVSNIASTVMFTSETWQDGGRRSIVESRMKELGVCSEQMDMDRYFSAEGTITFPDVSDIYIVDLRGGLPGKVMDMDYPWAKTEMRMLKITRDGKTLLEYCMADRSPVVALQRLGSILVGTFQSITLEDLTGDILRSSPVETEVLKVVRNLIKKHIGDIADEEERARKFFQVRHKYTAMAQREVCHLLASFVRGRGHTSEYLRANRFSKVHPYNIGWDKIAGRRDSESYIRHIDDIFESQGMLKKDPDTGEIISFSGAKFMSEFVHSYVSVPLGTTADAVYTINVLQISGASVYLSSRQFPQILHVIIPGGQSLGKTWILKIYRLIKGEEVVKIILDTSNLAQSFQDEITNRAFMIVLFPEMPGGFVGDDKAKRAGRMLKSMMDSREGTIMRTDFVADPAGDGSKRKIIMETDVNFVICYMMNTNERVADAALANRFVFIRPEIYPHSRVNPNTRAIARRSGDKHMLAQLSMEDKLHCLCCLLTSIGSADLPGTDTAYILWQAIVCWAAKRGLCELETARSNTILNQTHIIACVLNNVRTYLSNPYYGTFLKWIWGEDFGVLFTQIERTIPMTYLCDIQTIFMMTTQDILNMGMDMINNRAFDQVDMMVLHTICSMAKEQEARMAGTTTPPSRSGSPSGVSPTMLHSISSVDIVPDGDGSRRRKRGRSRTPPTGSSHRHPKRTASSSPSASFSRGSPAVDHHSSAARSSPGAARSSHGPPATGYHSSMARGSHSPGAAGGSCGPLATDRHSSMVVTASDSGELPVIGRSTAIRRPGEGLLPAIEGLGGLTTERLGEEPNPVDYDGRLGGSATRRLGTPVTERFGGAPPGSCSGGSAAAACARPPTRGPSAHESGDSARGAADERISDHRERSLSDISHTLYERRPLVPVGGERVAGRVTARSEITIMTDFFMDPPPNFAMGGNPVIKYARDGAYSRESATTKKPTALSAERYIYDCEGFVKFATSISNRAVGLGSSKVSKEVISKVIERFKRRVWEDEPVLTVDTTSGYRVSVSKSYAVTDPINLTIGLVDGIYNCGMRSSIPCMQRDQYCYTRKYASGTDYYELKPFKRPEIDMSKVLFVYNDRYEAEKSDECIRNGITDDMARYIIIAIVPDSRMDTCRAVARYIFEWNQRRGDDSNFFTANAETLFQKIWFIDEPIDEWAAKRRIRDQYEKGNLFRILKRMKHRYSLMANSVSTRPEAKHVLRRWRELAGEIRAVPTDQQCLSYLSWMIIPDVVDSIMLFHTSADVSSVPTSVVQVCADVGYVNAAKELDKR